MPVARYSGSFQPAPAADDVQAGQLLGEHGRVAQVVVEHERAEPQAVGRGGDRREDRHRRELRREVVVDGDVGDADRLGPSSALRDRARVHHVAGADHELEGPHAAASSDALVGATEGQGTNRVGGRLDPFNRSRSTLPLMPGTVPVLEYCQNVQPWPPQPPAGSEGWLAVVQWAIQTR
jgi:hypothetical protein